MHIKELEKKTDERGWLTEILRNEDLKNKSFGQIFITVAKPGVTKGGHYHKRKHEYFCVVRGVGELTLQKINKSEKILSTETILLGEGSFRIVELKPYFYHTIKNTGSEDMFLLVYTDEVFNPKDPDTYALKK